MTKFIPAIVLLMYMAAFPNWSSAAEWQWSVPVGAARAYLWIPSDCERVRGIVLANHNMIEQGILEHPTMRRTLTQLGFAEIWIVPKLDLVFDPAGDAPKRFDEMMKSLAAESGYEELSVAPVVALGHSANATWPWNFAAAMSQRTLAVLSVKGDAPQTNLTGFGGKNPNWGDRNIDGIPGLMVMGEFEWGDARLAPLIAFRTKHPMSPIALLGDAGHGHFDYSDGLVEFLAMFIRKAAAARLPELPAAIDATPALRPVDPQNGWLVDRWHRDASPASNSASTADFKGGRSQAFWAFDKEMVDATEAHYVKARAKKPQLLGIVQEGEVLAGEPCSPKFVPLADGMSFTLEARFLDSVSGNGSNPARWAGLPNGSTLDHAVDAGPIALSRIVGPAEQLSGDIFRLHFGRAEYTPDRRNQDVWLLASHPGDALHKSAAQQIHIHVPRNDKGRAQSITFPPIAHVQVGTDRIALTATSDANLTVQYYVREGPAEIEGDFVKITKIPPRAKYPITVTIVAWQWGTPGPHGVCSATPVDRTFQIRALPAPK